MEYEKTLFFQHFAAFFCFISTTDNEAKDHDRKESNSDYLRFQKCKKYAPLADFTVQTLISSTTMEHQHGD